MTNFSTLNAAAQKLIDAAVVAARAYGNGEHPFSPSSPWNTLIPTNPKLDPANAAISTGLFQSTSKVFNLIVYAYGQPVYYASPSTPRITLVGQQGYVGTTPVDPTWLPNVGGDEKMNIIDPAAGVVYELQYYDPTKKSVYWAVRRNIVSGLGDGMNDPAQGTWNIGPTGSGMSQFGGMIRLSDLAQGSINHALSFITSDPATGTPRYPASHNDGKGTVANSFVEGTRIQLDPAFDTSKLTGIEKMVAIALQKYGAYCTDSGGGNNMAAGFYCERPPVPAGTAGDPYVPLGVNDDWWQLRNIPRTSYRVLDASVTVHS